MRKCQFWRGLLLRDMKKFFVLILVSKAQEDKKKEVRRYDQLTQLAQVQENLRQTNLRLLIFFDVFWYKAKKISINLITSRNFVPPSFLSHLWSSWIFSFPRMQIFLIKVQNISWSRALKGRNNYQIMLRHGKILEFRSPSYRNYA